MRRPRSHARRAATRPRSPRAAAAKNREPGPPAPFAAGVRHGVSRQAEPLPPPPGPLRPGQRFVFSDTSEKPPGGALCLDPWRDRPERQTPRGSGIWPARLRGGERARLATDPRARPAQSAGFLLPLESGPARDAHVSEAHDFPRGAAPGATESFAIRFPRAASWSLSGSS